MAIERKVSSWKRFLMTLAATTVSIVLTFGTTAIIFQKKEQLRIAREAGRKELDQKKTEYNENFFNHYVGGCRHVHACLWTH